MSYLEAVIAAATEVHEGAEIDLDYVASRSGPLKPSIAKAIKRMQRLGFLNGILRQLSAPVR